ncbi:MAG: TIGR03943 family protein [Pontimonas sp.]|nr:TIGR03943 family protein [Pontimonas sp.]
MWRRFLEWRGVVAIAVLAVVSLWLGAEGRLGFYIHPRYNLFTIAMASIAIVLLVIAVVTKRAGDHDHDHSHSEGRRGPRQRRLARGETASLGFVVAVVAAVLVLPPATLSSATADNRSSNAVEALGTPEGLDGGAGLEIYETLTVRDWASLLSQNQNPSYYRGKPVNTVGIVTSSEGSPDVFLLTRFVVTCCAVDAQPVSIPVYMPGWQDEVAVDSWVRIEGGFQPAPSGVSSAPVVIVPLSITDEEVPNEPYLF